MSARSLPLPLLTPRMMTPRPGPDDAPAHPHVPAHISITASSHANTAPNVGGNTDHTPNVGGTAPAPVTADDAMSTGMSTLSHERVEVLSPPPSPGLVIPPPPTTLFAFWDWLKAFRCYTLTDLKTSVTTFNPRDLIGILGEAEYDRWRTRLSDIYVVFNFALKYFWFDPRIQIHLSIPYDKWLAYRSTVYPSVQDLFPLSSDFETPFP